MTSVSSETVLGQITSVFGVQGWVKVYSYTEPLDNIFQYPFWNLAGTGTSKRYRLLNGRWHGKTLLAKLDGVDDRDQAAQLCGNEIRVATEDLPPLDEGEYYWYQLEGLRVVTFDNQDLGVVDHLIETGSNDVLVVEPDPGSIDGRQRLIPFLPGQSIEAVQLESGVVVVNWDPDF